MTNWNCFFGRCKGSETPSKPQQSMMQAHVGRCGMDPSQEPGTCAQEAAACRPDSMLQSRTQPLDFPGYTSAFWHCKKRKTQEAEERELGSQSETCTTKSVFTFFLISFSHLYINRGNAPSSTFYSSSDFPSTTLPFTAS